MKSESAVKARAATAEKPTAELPDGKTLVRLRNILVATDFSAISETALNHAVSLARLYDAQLYVAHVIEPVTYAAYPTGLSMPTEQIHRSVDQQMTDLLISGRLRGVPNQVLVGEGELWPVLADMIEKHEIDLVVVGTHGRTGARKLLLGSRAEEIFRMASCPVLTVGPKVSRGAPAEIHPSQILYATDLTTTSQCGAGYALSLAQEHQACLTVLHVVREQNPSSEENRTRLKEYFIKQLRELVPLEADLWCQTEFVVEFGAPADEILKVAARKNANLIVLGVRRSALFPGHLPPATAYKVVCQSHCSVLTVRGT